MRGGGGGGSMRGGPGAVGPGQKAARGTFTVWSCTICRTCQKTVSPGRCEQDCADVNAFKIDAWEYLQKYAEWVCDPNCNTSGPIPDPCPP